MLYSKNTQLDRAFCKNAIAEMRARAREADLFADQLERTDVDVEIDALIYNFKRRFNHEFSEVLVRV